MPQQLELGQAKAGNLSGAPTMLVARTQLSGPAASHGPRCQADKARHSVRDWASGARHLPGRYLQVKSIGLQTSLPWFTAYGIVRAFYRGNVWVTRLGKKVSSPLPVTPLLLL